MNTKAFCSCGGGSNLILGTGMENQIFVYQMGRLCGGAHEISGIKAPLFLHGWVVGGGVGRDGWVSSGEVGGVGGVFGMGVGWGGRVGWCGMGGGVGGYGEGGW